MASCNRHHFRHQRVDALFAHRRRHAHRRSRSGPCGAPGQDDGDAADGGGVQRRRRRRGCPDRPRDLPQSSVGFAGRLPGGRGPARSRDRLRFLLGKLHRLREASRADHRKAHHLPGPTGLERHRGRRHPRALVLQSASARFTGSSPSCSCWRSCSAWLSCFP